MSSVGDGGQRSGLISSPDLGAGISVADAAGVERVRVGKISDTDYGIRIVSSDGTTVVIDGTSNMFKISATGTLTRSFPAGPPASATNTVTLSGLGTFSTPPAFLSMTGVDNSSPSNLRVNGAADIMSGGSTVARAYSFISLNGSNEARVTLQADSLTLNPGFTSMTRYYVLQEAGI